MSWSEMVSAWAEIAAVAIGGGIFLRLIVGALAALYSFFLVPQREV